MVGIINLKISKGRVNHPNLHYFVVIELLVFITFRMDLFHHLIHFISHHFPLIRQKAREVDIILCQYLNIIVIPSFKLKFLNLLISVEYFKFFFILFFISFFFV
jgi:hypothetical protein